MQRPDAEDQRQREIDEDRGQCAVRERRERESRRTLEPPQVDAVPQLEQDQADRDIREHAQLVEHRPAEQREPVGSESEPCRCVSGDAREKKRALRDLASDHPGDEKHPQPDDLLLCHWYPPPSKQSPPAPEPPQQSLPALPP